MSNLYKKIDPKDIKKITKDDENLFMALGSLSPEAQEYLLILTKRVNALELQLTQLQDGSN